MKKNDSPKGLSWITAKRTHSGKSGYKYTADAIALPLLKMQGVLAGPIQLHLGLLRECKTDEKRICIHCVLVAYVFHKLYP